MPGKGLTEAMGKGFGGVMGGAEALTHGVGGVMGGAKGALISVHHQAQAGADFLIACGLVKSLCFVAGEFSKDTFVKFDDGGSQLSDANGHTIAVAITDFFKRLGNRTTDFVMLR
jgi:hypothetical protein